MHLYSKTEFINISFAKFGAFQLMCRLLALILGEGEENIQSELRSQNTRHNLQTCYKMHRSNTSTVRSVVSELQTPLRNVLACMVCLVRTSNSVLKYRTCTFTQNAYRTTTSVPYFLAKIEACYIVLLCYRTAMLAHNLVEKN